MYENLGMKQKDLILPAILSISTEKYKPFLHLYEMFSTSKDQYVYIFSQSFEQNQCLSNISLLFMHLILEFFRCLEILKHSIKY